MAEIDLSLLPAPKVIEELDFETLLEAKKAKLIEVVPASIRSVIEATLALESEPLTIELEQQTYAEMILRQRINEAVAAEMLALSTGSDLDNLAARMGLRRKIIQEADEENDIEEITETDADFRRRIQMYPETYAAAGPVAAYIAHALDADNDVADASVEAHTPEPGSVTVHIKSHNNAGVPEADLLGTVSEYLSADSRRPLCDTVIVLAGKPKETAIIYTTEYEKGPDKTLVAQKQREDLDTLLASVSGLGAPLALSRIIGALDVTGAKKVVLLQPAEDIECLPSEFIRVTEISGTEAAT